MVTRFTFETAIEKIGRIIASQYGLNVVYEGSEAKTDGNTIYLPNFEDLTEELRQDINGYLDHEVSHCKFTQIPELNKSINGFHMNFLNMVEDIRVEREMIKEYRGTVHHLKPLRKKCRAKMEKQWNEFPWPIKIIIGTADLMQGDTPKIDAESKKYFDIVKPYIPQLNAAKTTVEMREITEEITKKLKQARDEEKKEQEKKQSKKLSEGEEDPGRPNPEDFGDEEKKPKESPEDKLLNEPKKQEKSDFEKIIDASKLLNDEIKKKIKTDEKEMKKEERNKYGFSSRPHVPFTTKFDKVTDYSGKGNARSYNDLKRRVLPLVSGIRRNLERILKVKENKKWTPERERGTVNGNSLAKLASNKSYRTIFREFTKTTTNNVAVELLVDMSGSMSGRMDVAKQAVVAIAEALKDLNIPFEVTGFYSDDDCSLEQYARNRMDDMNRYNRIDERLELFVFKSFDCVKLTGIEKMSVGAQNPDGECVRWAAKRLAVQKQKRKILMVFSDGMPATGEGNMDILNNDLKKVVKEIKKSGMEVIGFGIETNSVKHFYPDWIVINNVQDLPGVVMRKLSKLLTKGA